MDKILKERVVRIAKLIFFFFLEVYIFFNIAPYFGGMHISDIRTAVIVLLTLAVANAILWPLVSYISLSFIVFTLGIGTFLLDGFILSLLSFFIPEFSITGSSIFTVPLVIGIINSILSFILNVDETSTYYRYVLKKEMEFNNKDISDKDGFIFLEIDGLARNILEQAIDRGDMPTLKRWIDEGTHKLTKWETDLSSQTGASQAGILHGNNKNIPAFRWIEKENNNKLVSSNGFGDATMIEERISNHKGLLSNNGASRSNLFSGDASDYLLTFSKLGSIKGFYSKSWYYVYSNPYFIARVLILFLWDMFMELCSRIYHPIRNIKPRLSFRGFLYFFGRAGANVVMREASTFTLIGDIFAGQRDTVYTTYMGYDEIAHHSGIRDYDAFYALRQIDKQFSYIEKAIQSSKRKYNIIVLSDHGQSEGPTFKQKFGISLKELVDELLPESVTIHSILHSNDDHFIEHFSLKDYASKNKRKLTHKLDNTFDDTLDYIRDLSNNEVYRKYITEIKRKKELLTDGEPVIDRLNDIADEVGLDIHLPHDEVSIEEAQTIVLASGNLGLIYFTDWSTRLTYEQIEDAFPGLISGLAKHPGIGFVMVHSAIYGTICLCNDDVYYMDDDKYVGDHFLDKYGENIVSHLKRTDSFEHVPDILVNSEYDSYNDQVYAFEELIGSHGGAGSTQQEPFILYPSNWELNEPIIGAENVYKFFKKEIKNSWENKVEN